MTSQITSGSLELYKLLSLGFSYPDPGKLDEIRPLLGFCRARSDGTLRNQLSDLENSFGDLSRDIQSMQSEYLRLFDIGAVITPYETEYLREKASRKPFELADIGGFYSAFGCEINDTNNQRETPDHIAVELEFLSVLATKERFALTMEDKEAGNERAAIVRSARHKFLKDHLFRWGFLFCTALREQECSQYYKRLGELLEDQLCKLRETADEK